MSSLASIYPGPVEVQLAGRPYHARELRIRDLAVLHRWRDRQTRHPADRVGEREDYESEAAFLAACRAAFLAHEETVERAEVGAAPEASEDDEAPDLDPAREAALLLWLALRRDNRGFSIGDAAGLLAEMADGPGFGREWARLRRVALDLDPIERIIDALDPEWGSYPRPEGVTWGQAVEEVRALTGLSYREVGTMYLSQFGNIRRGGKPRETPSYTPPPGTDMVAWSRRQRAKFYGTGEPNSASGSPPPATTAPDVASIVEIDHDAGE